MNTTLLSKILNYEQNVFDEYLKSREKMLNFLKKIEINKLDQSQLLICIENLKNIIDPIKTSTVCVNNLISFEKNNVTDENEFIRFYLLFGKFFFNNSDSDSNEEIDSVSESESESGSDSEYSSSSRSASDMFSRIQFFETPSVDNSGASG